MSEPVTSKRLAMFETVLAKGSTDPFHHYAYAMELRSVGRKDDALLAFDKLAVQFADYVPTYLMAAQVADELGKREDARSWADRGLVVAQKKGDGHAASELATFRATLA